MAPTGYVPHLSELRSRSSNAAEQASDGTVAGFAQAASDLIHERFRYVKGATHVHSSIEDSLVDRRGRLPGFRAPAARRGADARTSGALRFRLSGPGSAGTRQDAKQEEVIGGQASHAWAEVLMPNSGWIGFDPTLGKPVGLRHVRVAYGRDYGDVAPVRGVYKGHAGQRLSVDVCVRPALDDSGHEQTQRDDRRAASPPPPSRAPAATRATAATAAAIARWLGFPPDLLFRRRKRYWTRSCG